MSKVMLVEDDNNLREIYEARLAAEGYEIVSAHDGEEALALAVKERPDLIISDIMMPKVSGFDMLDILRSTPETKDTKVIMMTALSQAEDRTRADKLGADRYLVKSQVTLEDVVKVAHEVLEGPAAPAAADPATATSDASVATPAAPIEPTAQTPAPEPAPVAAPAPTTEPTNVPVTPPPAEPNSTPTPEPTVQPTPPSEPATPAVTPIAVSEPPTDKTADTSNEPTEPVISMPPVAPQASEPEVPVAEPAPVTPVEAPQAPAPEPTPVAEPTAQPAAPAAPETPAPEQSPEDRIQSFIANNQEATPPPTSTPAPEAAPTPEPTPVAEEQSSSEETNQTSAPSHKKVIKPLNETISDPASDLNALLAKEVEKEGQAPPATNTVIAPQQSSTQSSDSTVDPNSIAL